MREPDENGWAPSVKTIRNKHHFLAGALIAAVPQRIPENPCDKSRLPDSDTREMVFLSVNSSPSSSATSPSTGDQSSSSCWQQAADGVKLQPCAPAA